MNKKYNTLNEAKAGMDKFKVEMEQLEKEMTLLNKKLQNKKEMLSYLRYQYLVAEEEAIDFELDIDVSKWN